MPNTTASGITIRTALFYFTLTAFCQGTYGQSEVRLRLVHDTLVVVSLMANNEGPFDFLFDTGAETTIVDPTLAGQLSLVALDHVPIYTLAGAQILTRSSMSTLAMGSARLENVEVLVQELSELRRVDSRIRGILGQNFLVHFNYLLNYRSHLIRFELADEIQDAMKGDRVHLEMAKNRMIIACEEQSVGLTKLRLLLDSGSNAVVLMRATSETLNAPTETDGLGVVSGGDVGVRVGRVRALTVGAQQFHEITVALPPAEPADRERLEDGLLPTALFRSLYVNNREDFVVFNPRVEKN